jgi:hypothetical protein
VNAFKRRRNLKKSVSSDNVSIDVKNDTPKPTFESIVQRVMRMRISEGVKGENEPPPDIPITGATLESSNMSNRNQSPSDKGRSRSHQRRVRVFLHKFT